MRKVVIWGIKDYAQLACHYFQHDTKDIVPFAFCVHADYLPMDGSRRFEGLPVISWERLMRERLPQYDPINVEFFAPIANNILRSELYFLLKLADYKMASYLSSKATILTDDIGEHCFILEDNTIQPFTRIGNNCVLWSGNHIGHHSVVEDDVTITSHCVVSGHCRIGRGSYLGVNCTIRDGVNIAPYSIIGQGANVVKDTEEAKTYVGNPAIILEQRKKERGISTNDNARQG